VREASTKKGRNESEREADRQRERGTVAQPEALQ
jgi:hypothetical protein